MICINGRCFLQPMTGVQRYAYEVVRRLQEGLIFVPGCPDSIYSFLPKERVRVRASAVSGHLWEQSVLWKAIPSGALLWSPAGCGPIVARRHILTIHDLAYLEYPEGYS